MRMGPHESSYNNGLGNVFTLPFLGLGALVLIILLCFFPKYFKWRTAIVVVSFYSALSFTAYLTPNLYGGYKATFRIVDRAGKPITGIRVDFLQQRSLTPGGPIALFFVQDFGTCDYSDNEGLVHVTANIFTRLFGTVNQAPQEPKPANLEFKIAEFTIMQDARGTIFQVNWTQPFGSSKNGDLWSENIHVPFRQPLTVYLASKDDDDSYPGN